MNKVEVYGYYESGDKIKRKVTGYAELVPREVTEFKEKTIMPADIMKPLVCREFCDKVKRCHLIAEGMGDLCKYHDKHKILVRRLPPKIEQVPDLKLPEMVKSVSRSVLRDDVNIPEVALAAPGINEPKIKWEKYSSSVYVCSHDDISDEKPIIEVTRKQQKNWSDRKETKRREKFMDKRGLDLQQKLRDMQFRNPVRAKEYAAKLSMNDWIAINQAGGLASA